MEKERRKGFDFDKDNNNIDPYGYDFVPTISHCENIDEQRKSVNYVESISERAKNRE